MTKTQALYNFFSSFGLDAYPVDNVPNDTTFPWLTYETSIASFNESTSIQIHLYYHTKSEATPNAKVEEISKKIGLGGTCVAYEGGLIWIKKGTPFANSIPDQNDTSIKHRAINLVLEFL